jgi:hypothetical protein
MRDGDNATKTPELLRPRLRELARPVPTAPSGNLAPPRDEAASPRPGRWRLPIVAVLAIAVAVGLGIWLLATMRA